MGNSNRAAHKFATCSTLIALKTSNIDMRELKILLKKNQLVSIPKSDIL
jgi:hypothetical protein